MCKEKENLRRLNDLFLEVKSHIGSLITEEDLLDYDRIKNSIMDRMNEVSCVGLEDNAVRDKIEIYYKFCESKIIPGIHTGNTYRFIR
ncbi:hypothetical protein UT300012_21250 [Paraclostridium bifermentans]